MNKFKVFFYFLLFFILLNLIIAFLWSFKTTIKFSNYTPYSEEFTKSLNLTKSESLELYLETWQRERLFEYDEFTGLKESKSINGNYVNIDQYGRLVNNNPKECKKRIFFYGGELIFGYDVADYQTIPHFFRDMLEAKKKDFCVFNYGRRTYNSTQENILLQKHLLKNMIKKDDIIIFLDGNNENGNKKILNTDFINQNYNELHQKYWKLGISGIKYFLNLLPITQLSEVIFVRFLINDNSKKTKLKISNSNLIDIKNVFENNLKIREAICIINEINCNNFLLFVNDNMLNKNKYEVLKRNIKINDLTNFENQNYLINRYNSLSPDSNRLIAKKIFQIVIN